MDTNTNPTIDGGDTNGGQRDPWWWWTPGPSLAVVTPIMAVDTNTNPTIGGGDTNGGGRTRGGDGHHNTNPIIVGGDNNDGGGTQRGNFPHLKTQVRQPPPRRATWVVEAFTTTLDDVVAAGPLEVGNISVFFYFFCV